MEKNGDLSTKEILSPKSTWSHTKSNIREASHIWRINNFNFLCQQSKLEVNSMEFSAGVDDKIKWMLELSIDYTDTVYLKLYFQQPQASVKAKYTLIIYDETMKEAKVKSNFHVFTKDCNRTSEAVGHKKHIFSLVDKILSNNELTVGCKVEYITIDTIGGRICNAEFVNSKPHCLNILELMFENKKFSDVEINVGGRTFQAHKAVLAAASPVFLAMFESNMRETEQNFINIDDIDEKTFEEILRFIYTGNVKNIEKIADTLFVAADKYDIDSLKHECEKQLCESLTVDNAIRILIYANFHSLNWLKAQVMTFMKFRRIDVTKTENFNFMIDSHRDLLAEIIREFAT